MTVAASSLLIVGACLMIAGLFTMAAGDTLKPLAGERPLQTYARKRDLIDGGFATAFWGLMAVLGGVALLAHHALH